MFNVEEARLLLKQDPSGRTVFKYCIDLVTVYKSISVEGELLKKEISALDEIFSMMSHCPDADDILDRKEKTRSFAELQNQSREEGCALGCLGFEFWKMYFRHGRGLSLPSMNFLVGGCRHDDKNYPGSMKNISSHGFNFGSKYERYEALWNSCERPLACANLNVESAICLWTKKSEVAQDPEKIIYNKCIEKFPAVKLAYENKIEDNFQNKLFFSLSQVDKSARQVSARPTRPE